MHLRVNIPAWSKTEIVRGAAAVVWPATRYISRLESTLARASADRQPVTVASARYGIALAVRELGLAGRRVAHPAYVCPAVTTALRESDASPVPIECAVGSPGFDREALRAAVERGEVDGVLAPNTYGIDQDYELLLALGVPVIEDAAYQAGQLDPRDGRLKGTRGHRGVWSFNFKALSGCGGGILWTAQSSAVRTGGSARATLGDVARFANYAARSLARAHIPRWLPGAGPPARGVPEEPRSHLMQVPRGWMTELQAALALSQWEGRVRLQARQGAVMRTILDALRGSRMLVPVASDPADRAPHLLPLLVQVRDGECDDAVHEARVRLHRRGIQTEDPYPMDADARRRFPAAFGLARRLVLVPCGASLTPHAARRVADGLEHASEWLAYRYAESSADNARSAFSQPGQMAG